MGARPRIGLDWLPARAHWPGAGRYARELARALARLPAEERARFELVLLELGRAPHAVGEPALGLAGLADPPRRARLALPARGLALLARLGLDASRLAGGLALVHQVRPLAGPPVRRAPECVALAELPPAGSEAEAGLRRRLGRAAGALVFSARAGELAARLVPAPERIARAPVGCEHWRRDLGALPERARPAEVVALGALRRGRGHLALLGALERLRAGGLEARLVLLGRRGDAEPLLADALARSPARAALERLTPEALPDGAVAGRVARASALAQLDPDPLTPVTPLEALALGTPVVAARAPALVEALGDDATWVEGAGDALEPAALADALAAAIASADDEPARARRLARAAPFTWEASARAHLAAWEKLLARA